MSLPPWKIALSTLVLATGTTMAAPPTSITIDGSLGHGSGTISATSPGFYNIPSSVGKTVGPNLFQSFGTFDLGTGDTASFQSGGAANIIARVTGGSASSIDGTLQSQANLFFINPAGVMFGANAALDVGGAFTVSTANYVKFSDGGIFHAQLGANDNLTSAPVSAFGFLTAHPAPVQFQDALLGVTPTMSLNVIAGDITVDDTFLIASSGNLTLFSAASAGEVPFSLASPGSGFSSATNPTFGNVAIRNGSLLAIDGTGGGHITIRGGHLTVDNSRITSNNTGAVRGGDISIQATNVAVQDAGTIVTTAAHAGDAGDIAVESDAVTIDGTETADQTTTGILSLANASGAGSITMTVTGPIDLFNGGQVSTTTSALGGNITITAGSMVIDDSAGFSGQSTGIVIASFALEPAAAALIDVDVADTLTITSGGTITSLGFTSGNGPNILVHAGALAIDSLTSTFVTGIQAEASDVGNVGAITVNVDGSLTLNDGGQIATLSFSPATSGNIVVTAGNIHITGSVSSTFDTGILTTADDAGDSGSISVTTPGALTLGLLGKISTASFSTGSSGAINVHAGSLTNIGGTIGTATVAPSSVTNAGNSGSVNVVVDHALILNDAGLIDAGTNSSGNAGAVTVQAGSLSIDGTGEGGLFTGITDQATAGGTGDAGNVVVHVAGALTIQGSGDISSNTFSSGQGGTVAVTAGSLAINGDNNATAPTGISANSNNLATGNGGSVTVNVNGAATITDRGEISITTFTSGNAGTLMLNVGGALTITDGGEVSGGTHSSGVSGAVWVHAGSLLIDGTGNNFAQTGISNQSNEGATGGSGPLNVTVDGGIVISAGGEISSGTHSNGNGGDVTVQAATLTIENALGVPHLTGITSETDGTTDSNGHPTGIGGDAGSVTVDISGALLMTGGRIDTDTFCRGNAGDVTVHAGSLTIDAVPDSVAPGIFSNSEGFAGDSAGLGGNAGSVTVAVDGNLVLAHQGGIGAATFTSGSGGNVTISAANFSMTGASTGVTAQARGSGDGGSITIHASNLELADHGIITASAFHSNGGTITITANKVSLIGGGTISTQAEMNGGDIALHVGNIVYLSYSGILASAGNNGGNVLIDPQFVVLDHSLISANAALGQGGNITIITDNFLNNLTLITATGATDGSINITAPVLDLSGDLVPLTGVIENDENRLRESCAASINHEFSSFILVGRGGAESSPNELQPDFGLDALPASPSATVQ